MFSPVAQTPSPVAVPTSGDFWNPSNWAPFISAVGIPGFMCLILFLFFIWFLWKGLTKWDGHLTRQEKLTKLQLMLCHQIHSPGGVANVSDFRDAGHEFADVLQDLGEGIGKETGAVIKPKIGKIHEKLRNVPSPFPSLDLSPGDQDG